MGQALTDLEITKRCAEAMGYKFFRSKHGHWTVDTPDGTHHVCCEGWPAFDKNTGQKLREPTAKDAILECNYFPLHDDAQAMALVKKFDLLIVKSRNPLNSLQWRVGQHLWEPPFGVGNHLNRAICECVAKMQCDKPSTTS